MSKKNYASRTIRGKLRVCRYLAASSELRSYVPRTVAFSQANLTMMAAQYSSLYVKPDVGSLGMGITKLRRMKSGSFELKEVSGRKQVERSSLSLGDAYRRIASRKQGKLIIQQAIKLDRVQQRSYDIRAMVQRKPGGSWTLTGYMVKVGAVGKIVTNYYQGGTIYTLGRLHDELGLSKKESNRRTQSLSAAAIAIANYLSSKQAKMHEMGIDFAYDESGHLWVLEVNSNHPQFHPLKSIDRIAYNRMKEYAASYGRYQAR